ncbi:MAG: lipase family protein [Dinghuibacter sp.]|nr:lipase family protein [Dinghuibacter sp.]
MGAAKTLAGRLLCACNCAYKINGQGVYTPTIPYNEATGWNTSHPPVAVFGGDDNINACLVGVNTDGIIIAFRGTIAPALNIPSILDWWQDIVDCPPITAGSIPGKIHSGFWKATATIWEGIVKQVQQFREQFPGMPLYITGHSKGGALASIAAANIIFNDNRIPQPKAVYTFASPHAGDEDYVNGFPGHIPVTRYENYLDIVPFLPPEQGFINLVSKIPLVGNLFAKASGWDYAPLGDLEYIQEDLDITCEYFGLSYIRLGELVWNMAQGESGFVNIGKAHHSACGGGYFSAICADVTC